MDKLTFVAQLSLDFIFGGVKALPRLGEEVFSKTFDIQLGGGTLVYPIVLTKLGVDCHVIIKKSASIQAELAYSMLESYLIKEIEIVEEDEFDSVMSTAVISLEKDRSFISNNNFKAFSFEDSFLLERYQGSKVIFATEQNTQIIPQLKANGSIIVFDVGWSEDLSLTKYEKVLKYVDYFTPNDKEAMKMTGTNTVEESLKVLSRYVSYPVVSCGKKGCMTILNENIICLDIPENINAVDTTGAGDNFMAGLIYGIYKEMSLQDCIKFANCTGALSTTGYGCYGAAYTKEDVIQLFESSYCKKDIKG